MTVRFCRNPEDDVRACFEDDLSDFFLPYASLLIRIPRRTLTFMKSESQFDERLSDGQAAFDGVPIVSMGWSEMKSNLLIVPNGEIEHM